MLKYIVSITLFVSMSNNALCHAEPSTKEVTDAFFAFQLKHSIKEKRILLSQVQDEAAKKLIACSVVKETKDLIDFVEQDVSKLISSKDLLRSLEELARKERKSLISNNLGQRYGC